MPCGISRNACLQFRGQEYKAEGEKCRAINTNKLIGALQMKKSFFMNEVADKLALEG